MNIHFRDKKLEALYTDKQDAHRYPPGVVDAFFDAITIILAAKDEQEFYPVRSLRAKKLKGDRRDQWSVRLNQQYRLIVLIKADEQGDYAEIVEIVDYH